VRWFLGCVTHIISQIPDFQLTYYYPLNDSYRPPSSVFFWLLTRAQQVIFNTHFIHAHITNEGRGDRRSWTSSALGSEPRSASRLLQLSRSRSSRLAQHTPSVDQGQCLLRFGIKYIGTVFLCVSGINGYPHLSAGTVAEVGVAAGMAAEVGAAAGTAVAGGGSSGRVLALFGPMIIEPHRLLNTLQPCHILPIPNTIEGRFYYYYEK